MLKFKFVNVQLNLELWEILQQSSQFFRGQVSFYDSIGKPPPEDYQFGVPPHLKDPQDTFENLLLALHKTPGHRILDFTNFLKLCEYLLVDEELIITLICNSVGAYQERQQNQKSK